MDTKGIIQPILKNKGSQLGAENYRPITLLSCLGKLFTAVLNKRLQNVADNKDLLNEFQAGFRSKYSTTDNMFVLHCLIQIVRAKKKKLFCAFIDLKAAFDSVWRSGLWSKLVSYNIGGKFLKVIQNMYSSIKSCVRVNGKSSNYCVSNIGVRQ